jgi:hypothetical protein
MKSRMRVIGRIGTERAREDAKGLPGWEYKDGLWRRRTLRNKNMIVTAGFSMTAMSLQYGHANAGKSIRYIEVGTGFAYPAKADTALGTAVTRKEIASWDNTNIAEDPVVMIASVQFTTSEAVGALMECGLFQELTGAPMFSRGLFGYGPVMNATQGNPVVITSIAHGLTDADKVLIEGVAGMTELNGNSYFIKKLSDDTFSLYSDDALTATIDGTGFGAYSEASPDADTWKLVIPKANTETLTVTYPLTFTAD